MLEFLFPGGKWSCVTFSYDDGVRQDKRLIDIFNRNGLRGTFHLNSGTLGNDTRLAPEEVAGVYAGHEVAVHSVTHPHLDRLPGERVVQEIWQDRLALEALVGYPVRGMSYPYGSYSARVKELLGALGIAYSRTVVSTHGFRLPEEGEFLEWKATCHHKDRLLEHVDRLLEEQPFRAAPRLLYVWGHSNEFDKDDNWELIETAAERLSSRSGDIWAATNIQIYDYMQAFGRLQVSAAGDVAYNPSVIPVWFKHDGQAREIAGGQTLRLA